MNDLGIDRRTLLAAAVAAGAVLAGADVAQADSSKPARGSRSVRTNTARHTTMAEIHSLAYIGLGVSNLDRWQ